ncbi:putative phosphoserine phosphatase; homoserine phosphotransferase [Candidatus Desulfarcum epimagneticum]|uniref:phosphoserine phosphatase n=1 Tax=uncultured Desulfobacteraceae bacterium TaxID=218296 RepID=A0A484HE02_9BACT|nr:putative phosphoserine phosphatase; homoserine phosphotransferase [uncultured Desulfobacteraceae bacterium]
MNIICTDMEGVLVPEIWIGVAEATGVKELRLTTRDISDYDELMRKRLSILKENKITLPDIQRVIDGMAPLEGAVEFLEWLRSRVQTIVVSDTFSQFAGPLLKKLSWPTLFCNELVIGPNGSVDGYRLRQKDGKRKTVLALRSLEFRIVAMGDSYNDISMLKEADQGILFRPPENVRREFPEFPVTERFDELKSMIQSAL